MEFTNVNEYLTAKEKHDAYHAATMQWLKENKTNGIPCAVTETFPFAAEVSNELRSAIETFEFLNNPPVNYTLYVNEETGEVTTWTGQKLGRYCATNVYRSNFRDVRQTIRVKAINGLTYYGTYYKSAGQYARIKLCKFETKF